MDSLAQLGFQNGHGNAHLKFTFRQENHHYLNSRRKNNNARGRSIQVRSMQTG